MKVKSWKKKYSKQIDREKKAGVPILIISQIRLQKSTIKRDPEGQFIIVKGKIHQEDINVINMNAHNIRAPKYIRKILEDFKKDIDMNTVTLGVLTPHCQKWIDLPKKKLKIL